MRTEYTWDTLAALRARWAVCRPAGSTQIVDTECDLLCPRFARKCLMLLAGPKAPAVPAATVAAEPAATSLNLLDAALQYHARGWCVIPMVESGKQPAVRWKPYQTSRPSVATLRDWFGSHDSYGMAVVFGDISGGLGSRDFDDMESYTEWATCNPELAATLPTVRTHRGRHVYFATTPASVETFRQSIGKGGMNGAIHLPDGELRIGSGCYSLVPPTPHLKGGVYEWLIPLSDELPVVTDFVAAGLYRGSRLIKTRHSGSRTSGRQTPCARSFPRSHRTGSAWREALATQTLAQG